MHALFWLKTPIHPNEMYDVICAELPHAHEDPVLPSSWGLWRPQPKCAMHERRGGGRGKMEVKEEFGKTIPTQPSQLGTQTDRDGVSNVSKKVTRGWRSQSSLTSSFLLLS